MKVGNYNRLNISLFLDMAKYTVNMQKGNEGEAFLMSLLSKHALANRITGANDIGLDFLCEWVYNEDPSGLLFAIQVKTTSSKIINIEAKGINKLNQLKQFKITNKKSGELYPWIKGTTLKYWKNFEIPIYFFVAVETIGGFKCYYKRYTPILHKDNMRKAEKNESFHEVYIPGGKFLVFSDNKKQIGGFVRDLFIDYIRCKYDKGHLAYINPRKIGLNQFPKKYGIFKDLYKEYKSKIDTTYHNYQKFYREISKKK